MLFSLVSIQKNPGQVWAMAEEQIHVAHQIEWAFSGRGLRGVGGSQQANKLWGERR